MRNYPPAHALQPAPLAPVAPVALQPGPEAAKLAAESLGESARRNYRACFFEFAQFCQARGVEWTEAAEAHFADYLAHCTERGLGKSALSMRQAAVAYAFGAAGLLSPTAGRLARSVMKGARRRAAKPVAKAPALVAEKLRAVLDEFADERGIAAARDRALLALGFGAALRRSEIAELRIGDIQFCPEGALVTVRRSKTDQTAKGAVVPVVPARKAAHCPVRLLRRYLQAIRRKQRAVAGKDWPLFRPATRGDSHLRSGPLSGAAVGAVVKRRCAAAGMNGFTGHSLRAGAVTSMNKPGGDLAAVMRHARHSSPAITAGYVRPARRFEGHPGRGIL